MKIAITGHTKKFGKILFDRMVHYGHEVIGFSRVTNHDLNTNEGRLQFINDINDCDVIILNCRVGQCEMLELLYHSDFLTANKTIIVLSSRASDAGVFTKSPMYASQKNQLDFLSRHYAYAYAQKCAAKLILLRPTYLSGTGHDDCDTINSVEVSDVIHQLLTNPCLSTLRELTLYGKNG